MGVQRRYVPNFNGLIYGKVEPDAQGRDSTFTFRHAQLKKAILLLKTPTVPRLFLGTVDHFITNFYEIWAKLSKISVKIGTRKRNRKVIFLKSFSFIS